MGRWLEKLHSQIQERPNREPTKPTKGPFIGSIGSSLVGIENLREAEAKFASLETAPLNVVLCVADPHRPKHWVAYRRTNRHQLGRGDSQATAVLALARAEDDAGRRRGL